jgi:ubiquinone/menaquinone biosynthesis C-methylase UbiE
VRISEQLSEWLTRLARTLDGNGHEPAFGSAAGHDSSQQGSRRVLDPNEERQRRAFASRRQLPGMNAPAFSVLRDVPDLKVLPLADPMVPMYMLDKNYRILDWNEAFNLVFDRTMEGRRGESVLEWVYFLENYDQVIAHGEKAFAAENELPVIDIEELTYRSFRYDAITATKRAYQIPDDQATCSGWLAILDLKFADEEKSRQFQADLINVLQTNLMWSAYATSYDIVLNNTDVYPRLLAQILGESEDMQLDRIPPDARILDLGAGTGNITEKLVSSRRQAVIFAVENNRTMLNLLKYKCKPFLRQDDKEPGVIALKQDISSLYGIPDAYFDYVIMNNVFYTLDEPVDCMREVNRVLKPGGEVRISGPQRTTDVDRLLRVIRKELEKKGRFDVNRSHFQRVVDINRQLEMMPNFRRWDVNSIRGILLDDAEFSDITYETQLAYAGDAMLVSARR